jgi:processive 1,2-diacylglycerol beta-glucosyltransferase
MPTPPCDLVVIHSPVGGGHKSAALAVCEAAEARGLRVTLLDTFDYAPKVFGRAYLQAHLTGQSAFPQLYGPLYFAANRRGGAFEPVRRGFDHVALAPLVAKVLALQPRAVVATHHLPLVVLGRARRDGRLAAPLVGVVTDYTSHAVWAERGVDAFTVPCALAKTELEAHGVAGSRIAITGIPVRRAFHALADVAAPGPGEPLRVLVTSGGFGVGPMRQIVRALAAAGGVELTVVCGNGTGLVEKATREAADAGVRARVIGFERDMPARVGEAHVVVGKSGGLTVSETLAAGRPMIVVGAVPGNETCNEAFVVDGGAGVAARPDTLERALADVRARGVDVMGRRARSLVPRWSADRVAGWAEGWADALAARQAA